MSIISSIWNFLSVVRLPRVAAGFSDNSFVALEIKKRRGQLQIERMASSVYPKALLQPDFSVPNIPEPTSLAGLMRQVSERAGLARESRWSIALPEGVARSFIVNFESKPESRDELNEMIGWKVERVVGIDPKRLRIMRQQIPGEGAPRYLITCVEEAVISEYEAVFQLLGWHVGMIAPRHIGEASWLAIDGEPGDKMIVSHTYWGFVAVAMQGDTPIMVRVLNCGMEDRENELYRLATYYREKVMQGHSERLRVLPIGDPHEVELTANTFADALSDLNFILVTPAQLNLNIPDAGVNFGQVAAAAGLAALSYY